MAPPIDPAASSPSPSSTPTPPTTLSPPTNSNTNTNTSSAPTPTPPIPTAPHTTPVATAAPSRTVSSTTHHRLGLPLHHASSAPSPASPSAAAPTFASAVTTPGAVPPLHVSPRHSGDENVRHFFSKKFHRRHSDRHAHSPATMEFPDRLKVAGDGGDEEVLRPNIPGSGVFMNLNQSIFGLIAAAGSTVNFNDRFEGQSSDEDDDAADAGDGASDPRRTPRPGMTATTVLPAASSSDKKSKRRSKDMSQSTIFTKQSSSGTSSPPTKGAERRSRLSESKLLRSLPTLKSKLTPKHRSAISLSSRSSKAAGTGGGTGSSRILEEDEEADDADVESTPAPSFQQTQPESETDSPVSPTIHVTRAERSNSIRSIAPVMSRMLEAKAELVATRPSFDLERRSSSEKTKDTETDAGGPSALARKLMEIFEFEAPEEVIEEYPCWLLQSVLLQGYMYITARHICFYAYLPKKANEVAKSGYLAKSGKRNPKYNRYWFRLKGDVLAYYRDPSNLYFPHGQIDLRYGISATVTDKDKDGVNFQVVTHHRTYYFRADSAPSAKEWVKSLQRVIFRSHNDGDSVKISLPIQNVIDIEETQTMVEFADTCKIRVIDNDETYAVDEYFFSFFDYGKEAVRILRILIEDSSSQQQQQDRHQQALDRLGLPASAADDGGSQGSGSQCSGTDQKGTQAAASSSDGKLPKPARLHDSVRATLAPASPLDGSPRASAEIPRGSFDALRSSFGGGGGGGGSSGRRSLDMSQVLRSESPRRSFSDRVRRSVSGDRRVASGSRQRPNAQQQQQQQSDHHESTDSFAQSSVDDPSQASFSNLVVSTSDDPTASQILHGSEVFQSPTVAHRSSSTSRRRLEKRKPQQQLPASPATPGKPKGLTTPPAPTTPNLPHHAATTGHLADSEEASSESMRQSAAAAMAPGSLQNLAKYGSYPLQRAGVYAGWLNRQSRRMSSLLATESMGYVEKVSGMWKGGHQHYGDPAFGARTDDELDDEPGVSGTDLIASNERFRAHFALPSTEKLQATYFGYLMRVLPLYGKIYISDRSFCFRSLLPGTRTKVILPLKDIENVTKEKGFRFGFSGLVVVIRGHEELFFEFGQADMRDDCAVTLLQSLETSRFLRESGILNEDEKADAEAALAERDALQEARQDAASRQDENPESTLSSGNAPAAAAAAAAAVSAATDKATEQHKRIMRQAAAMTDSPTILFDDPKASFLNFKPAQPLRITCLTIGSRGDVQPYIALGRGLLAEGHHVKIATHPEFEGWIRSHGLDYGRVEGDPGELMRLCIENGTFTFQFLREANSKMRSWLDELLSSAWTACKDAELLIESPSAMAGIHIAEKLQIPYFRAFTMPWTRTRAYPHAFIMPEHKMGGAYNYITYVMFDNIFWKATASQINRWRNKTLGLPNTTLEKMQPNKVPFLYNFSPSVVPPPLDYSDWIRVTGYWFLDEGKAANAKSNDAKSEASSAAADAVGKEELKQPPWTPPEDLTNFIAQARKDGKKLVYVGFGSILVPDPAKMTQEVIDAVLKADVRCILSKGWSDRLVTAKDKDQPPPPPNPAHEVPLPPEIFQIKSAPHDWLFAQIDAAAHHGGSGTTGASLRAGIPTIIRPFFGDQFFFGGRVEDLGVGICLKKWGAMSFARALWEATNSERMIKKAAALGQQIREENGVDMAIQCIYRDMEYAKSLVKAKASKSGAVRHADDTETGESVTADALDDDEEPEESWTFVGDDDPMQLSMILTPEPGSPAALSGRALGSRVLGTAVTVPGQ